MFQILIYFYVRIVAPLKKVTPSFPATPFKSRGSVKPPFLKIWLEAEAPLQKGGVPTMWRFSKKKHWMEEGKVRPPPLHHYGKLCRETKKVNNS